MVDLQHYIPIGAVMYVLDRTEPFTSVTWCLCIDFNTQVIMGAVYIQKIVV